MDRSVFVVGVKYNSVYFHSAPIYNNLEQKVVVITFI